MGMSEQSGIFHTFYRFITAFGSRDIFPPNLTAPPRSLCCKVTQQSLKERDTHTREGIKLCSAWQSALCIINLSNTHQEELLCRITINHFLWRGPNNLILLISYCTLFARYPFLPCRRDGPDCFFHSLISMCVTLPIIDSSAKHLMSIDYFHC
jgi:hypothetical protein